jgi:hypothetical protein
VTSSQSARTKTPATLVKVCAEIEVNSKYVLARRGNKKKSREFPFSLGLRSVGAEGAF